MKTLLSIMIVLQIFLSPLSFAQGDSKGNGGEENEILYSVVATEIKSWIRSGGHHALTMKPNVSHDQFAQSMLAAIDQTQIRFTEEPIVILNANKTCHNFVEATRPVLRCNIERFRQLTVPERFNLLFHEFAGIAGFERDENGKSHYHYTDQAMKFLEMKVVYSLKVQVQTPPGFEEFVIPRSGNFQLTGFNPLNQEHLRIYDAAKTHCMEQAQALKARIAGLVTQGADPRANDALYIPTLEYSDRFHCNIKMLAPMGVWEIKERDLAQTIRSYKRTEVNQYLWDQSRNPNVLAVNSSGIKWGTFRKISTRHRSTVKTVELKSPVIVNPTQLIRSVPSSADRFCEANSDYRGRAISNSRQIYGNPDRPDCIIELNADGSTKISGSITDGSKNFFPFAFLILPTYRQYTFGTDTLSFNYIGLKGSGARPEHVGLRAIQVEVVLDPSENIQSVNAVGDVAAIIHYSNEWPVRRDRRGTTVIREFKKVRITLNGRRYLNRYVRP